MDDTTEYNAAEPWPYPTPPWELGLDSIYFFLGLQPINGTHPPDNVPDPNVTFVSVPGAVPSAFSIARFSSSPWGGPWDQVRQFRLGLNLNSLLSAYMDP